MSKNKFTTYLLYAIGEIFLVVIGILIAVSLNNLNEERKASDYQNKVFRQIYFDIKNDSLELLATIDYYHGKNVLFNQVLYDSVPNIAYDTISLKDQLSFAYGIRLVTNFLPFTNTEKGYQLFKAINNTDGNIDSLFTLIEEYYSAASYTEEYFESLRSVSRKNIIEFQQMDWFLDLYLERKVNPDYVEYISKSDDFKNRIINYKIYAIRNYLNQIKEQQKKSEILKRKIKSRLSKNGSMLL